MEMGAKLLLAMCGSGIVILLVCILIMCVILDKKDNDNQ